MGRKFSNWTPKADRVPLTLDEVRDIILRNRCFEPLDRLEYGDHGLQSALDCIGDAIERKQRIALYADYDVDGTMSCVSWVWFLEALGYSNFVHYIPCRFKEGYGVNLEAIKHLIDQEKVDLIITMDTGITANEEAQYCRERGIKFVCTDHHKVQPDRMPDCIILNPKLHPDDRYQELCGCGITFVLLRQLSKRFPVPAALWTDLLALAGMATICDVVPLNSVNHELAKKGVAALMKSNRPVLKKLREAAAIFKNADEKDVGFRLGPRINAVGRLGHANQVIEAFLSQNVDPLVEYMNLCNERRKQIQEKIVREADALARQTKDGRILFLGGDWHPGVIGIAASKIAERYWKPTWLFQRQDGVCKGSARSIPGFDVTAAMQSVGTAFSKFGGHKAAGGFTFDEQQESAIARGLEEYAQKEFDLNAELWQSRIQYDCELPLELADLPLCDHLDELKPFGMGFEEPKFFVQGSLAGVDFLRDKKTGEPRHTAVTLKPSNGRPQRIMFFNEALTELEGRDQAQFIVSVSRNTFRGRTSVSLLGHDLDIC